MLISAVVYRDGHRVADIEPSEIHRYVCAARIPGLGGAIRTGCGARSRKMQREFDLHPLAVEDARNGHQRPKIEEYGDCLFAVLQIIEPEGEGIARR